MDVRSYNRDEWNLQVEQGNRWTVSSSHSIEEQIDGQLKAGFLLTGLYEDPQASPLGKYMPAYIATWAIKPIN
jgi:hypothetical protein